MSVITNLFTSYTLVDIILILFLSAFVFKETLQLKDFFHNRGRAKISEEQKEEQYSAQILEKMEELEDQISVLYDENTRAFNDIRSTLKNHEDTLELLIQSDKDDIRADIVKQHHYFITKGYIDDFSMDAIERRYDHYKQEGGNSYITDLVHDLRALPKR